MEVMDDKALDARTRTRIVVYDFLRRVFLHEPTTQFFGRLAESDLFGGLSGLPGIKKMEEGVKSALSSGDIDAIRQDFYQLFLGPRRLKAPPWESVYRSGVRLVNQEAAAEVRSLYAQYGFETEAGQLEDHFGTECDFLYRLCVMSVGPGDERYDNLISVQRYFVEEHLLKWVPNFAEDIRKEALTPYFKGLGEFIDYWIWTERYYLGETQR